MFGATGTGTALPLVKNTKAVTPPPPLHRRWRNVDVKWKDLHFKWKDV